MAKLNKHFSHEMATRVAEVFALPSKDLLGDFGVKKKHMRKFAKLMAMATKPPYNVTIGKINKLQMWLSKHKYGSLALLFDVPGEQINSPNLPGERTYYISCIKWHIEGGALKWLKYVSGDELDKVCTDFNLRVNYTR